MRAFIVHKRSQARFSVGLLGSAQSARQHANDRIIPVYVCGLMCWLLFVIFTQAGCVDAPISVDFLQLYGDDIAMQKNMSRILKNTRIMKSQIATLRILPSDPRINLIRRMRGDYWILSECRFLETFVSFNIIFVYLRISFEVYWLYPSELENRCSECALCICVAYKVQPVFACASYWMLLREYIFKLTCIKYVYGWRYVCVLYCVV